MRRAVSAVALAAGLLGLAAPSFAGVRPATGAADLDRAYAPRRVALLIGVDHYNDPALQALSFAGKDANDLATVLRDPVYGDYDVVHVLTGKDATDRADIERKIREVAGTLQRDDTFLLYLSGHGTLELDLDGTHLYFLPSDGKLDAPEQTAIDVAWLERTMSGLVPKRRVLIMDTCHNGRSKSGLAPGTEARLKQLRGDPPPPNTVAEVSESEARLYAAQYYQPAMEDPKLGNGVYTHFLIQALTTARGSADLDRDGLVDVQEAFAYARDGTIRYTGGLQVPRAEYRIVGNENIYLAGDASLRKQAERALFSAYAGLLASAQLLVDGTPRGELPGVVAVEPGRHRIEVRTPDGRTVVSKVMNVRAGDVAQIEDLLRPETPSWTVGGGAVLVHGPGADYAAPLAGELEVSWMPAWQGALAMDLHARASYGRTTLIGPAGQQWRVGTGATAAGAFLGASPLRGLAVGPELEAFSTWQVTEGDDTPRVGLTAAPGLRARYAMPVGGATELALRYDVRVIPFADGPGDWTAAVTHSALVGVSFR